MHISWCCDALSQVLRIINEPSAAALAYYHSEDWAGTGLPGAVREGAGQCGAVRGSAGLGLGCQGKCARVWACGC